MTRPKPHQYHHTSGLRQATNARCTARMPRKAASPERHTATDAPTRATKATTSGQRQFGIVSTKPAKGNPICEEPVAAWPMRAWTTAPHAT